METDMWLCILAKNENIEESRELAKAAFPGHDSLKIPVSENGEFPETHWFCAFVASDEMKEKILSIQKFSEIELSNPIHFLEKRNLKRIKVERKKPSSPHKQNPNKIKDINE
jgi:hypothetical protein